MKFWYVVTVNSYSEIGTTICMTEEEGRKDFKDMVEYYERGGEDYEGRGVNLLEFEVTSVGVTQKILEEHKVDDVALFADDRTQGDDEV